MRKSLIKLALTATLGLAMAFTFSCSDDKDDGGSGSGGGGKSGYCEVAGLAIAICLEIPNNECSSNFYTSSYPEWQYASLPFEIVSKCENPTVICFLSDNDGTYCGLMGISKGYCEDVLKGKSFKTPKECLDYKSTYTPPAPTGPLCLYNDWCGNVKNTEACTQVKGTIVDSCD